MPLKSPLSTSGAGRVQRRWRAKAASATRLVQAALTDKLQHEHKVQRRHNVVNALNVATRWMAKCPNVPAQVHNHCQSQVAADIHVHAHTATYSTRSKLRCTKSVCTSAMPGQVRGKSTSTSRSVLSSFSVLYTRFLP